MHYKGGKHCASRWIAEHILNLANGRDCYLEPFVGGASVAARVAGHFQKVILSDRHSDLILCWQALWSGWMPDTSVSEARYRELRTAKPSAERGFVGFGCSFGGAFFNGFARDAEQRNYADTAYKSCLRKIEKIRRAGRVVWRCADYSAYRPDSKWVVYCDPPYHGVSGYDSAFDQSEFWNLMDAWSLSGATVLVSEYSAPSGWRCVGKMQTPAIMAGAGRLRQTERLFVRATTVQTDNRTFLRLEQAR